MCFIDKRKFQSKYYAQEYGDRIHNNYAKVQNKMFIFSDVTSDYTRAKFPCPTIS